MMYMTLYIAPPARRRMTCYIMMTETKLSF